MRNGHIAERTPIIKLKAAALYLENHSNCTDAQVAQASGIARRTANTLRRVAEDAPQHLPYILNGGLSLDAAMKLRRKMKCALPVLNGSQQPTHSDVTNLLNTLRAWAALTRELIETVEDVFGRDGII